MKSKNASLWILMLCFLFVQNGWSTKKKTLNRKVASIDCDSELRDQNKFSVALHAFQCELPVKKSSVYYREYLFLNNFFKHKLSREDFVFMSKNAAHFFSSLRAWNEMNSEQKYYIRTTHLLEEVLRKALNNKKILNEELFDFLFLQAPQETDTGPREVIFIYQLKSYEKFTAALILYCFDKEVKSKKLFSERFPISVLGEMERRQGFFMNPKSREKAVENLNEKNFLEKVEDSAQKKAITQETADLYKKLYLTLMPAETSGR